MFFLAIIIYLFVTILLTIVGFVKQDEVLKIFLISLLLTPIVAGVYMLFKKKNYTNIRYYNCSECNYIFPEKAKHCPICEENGYAVKLKKYKSPYEIAKNISNVNYSN